MKKINESLDYTYNQCNLFNDMESFPCIQCRYTPIFVIAEPMLYR